MRLSSLSFAASASLLLLGAGCSNFSASQPQATSPLRVVEEPTPAETVVEPYATSTDTSASSTLPATPAKPMSFAFPGAQPAAEVSKKVRIKTTLGDIVIAVRPDLGPLAASNFVYLAKNAFYDGTIFHRVIDNFMIQGGGMKPDMSEKPTRAPIPLESRNGLSNVKGSVAMARTMVPDSATAQFYINVRDNAFLDAANSRDGHGYAVFGKVVSGLDVVDKIKAVPTASKGPHQNVPVSPVLIRKASLEN